MIFTAISFPARMTSNHRARILMRGLEARSLIVRSKKLGPGDYEKTDYHNHVGRLYCHNCANTVSTWYTARVPRKSEWFQYVPAALEELAQFPAPVVDRATLERLLRLGRREAIRLMHRFGGYMAGKTFLIDRFHLIRQLEAITAGDEFGREQRRMDRLTNHLSSVRRELAARRIRIEPPESPTPALPAGVRLTRGLLQIEFTGTEQLLQRLLGLAQTISADYEKFRDLTEPDC